MAQMSTGKSAQPAPIGCPSQCERARAHRRAEIERAISTRNKSCRRSAAKTNSSKNDNAKLVKFLRAGHVLVALVTLSALVAISSCEVKSSQQSSQASQIKPNTSKSPAQHRQGSDKSASLAQEHDRAHYGFEDGKSTKTSGDDGDGKRGRDAPRRQGQESAGDCTPLDLAARAAAAAAAPVPPPAVLPDPGHKRRPAVLAARLAGQAAPADASGARAPYAASNNYSVAQSDARNTNIVDYFRAPSAPGQRAAGVNIAGAALSHLYDAPSAVEPPHSDARCPMRAPLTVCDQIEAYPADLIIHRLQIAQRQLDKTYFDIDSFFSDERDHLTEPFDDDAGLFVASARLLRAGGGLNASAPKGAPAYYATDQTNGVPSGEHTPQLADEFLQLVERNGVVAASPAARLAAQRAHRSLARVSRAGKRREHRLLPLHVHGARRRLVRQTADSPPTDSMERPDSTIEQQPLCRARSIFIRPRAALNDKKQWKFVVNAPERDPRIRQIIRVDICEDPFGPCSGQVSAPLGFASQCKQKYAKKKLLALDARSGLLEVDTFFIPSCCVCQLVPLADVPNGALGPDAAAAPPLADQGA